ncbi:type I-C CRISPR-associated endonuclease Cas1c [Martelella sp. AD-3]|uniref:type I-C CRISPR-associated endonuclease Cas1c n=1 Tax=Martelella sp. AD-3 TaxID=686597 RepID=UPI00046668D3|nr:type I-C CRISPR-associated endonuclease Cas1c [Martelella sp. AD-3]AMM84765.1 type I-C CRISPR-associated endonuclease Cas1 [Martelella sp. AD-3]
MKKLLNTFYAMTEGVALSKDGENLVAAIEGAERGRVPLHMLSGVVVFGAVYCSPPLMGALADAGITLTFLTRSGKFQARLEGPVSGNVLLRRAQYRASDQPVEIVRSIVTGKVANQRAVLMRSLRDYGSEYPSETRAALEDAGARLARIARRSELSEDTVDGLRGLEGEAANLYFSVFDHLIRAPDPEICWRGRSRRPPLDPVNALLSFLYTLLVHDCRSALEAVGLDPAVGFLHRDRPGRPSLALDLMEELRPVLADRLALSLFNRRQLRVSDFEVRDGGAVVMSDEARKTVIATWQERKKVEREHPFLGEKAPVGLVPYLQAQLLARHLRGDLDAYPPWFWK